MAGLLNVIGIGLTGITMIPFLESLIPRHIDRTTTVRIGVGLAQDDKPMDGNIPGIRLFDNFGHPIGAHRGNKGRIAEGGYHDISIVGEYKYKTVLIPGPRGDYHEMKVKDGEGMGGRQAEYISVSKGGNDPLCIAYISVNWPDGGKNPWFGDTGKACGADWYVSQTIAGSNNYRPACTWIDGDTKTGHLYQGMGIHITDFTATFERTTQYSHDNATMCQSKPRFHMYHQLSTDDFLPYFDPPLVFNDTLEDIDRKLVLVSGSSRGPLPPNRRRSIETRDVQSKSRFFMRDRLITSEHQSHSAAELCNSQTSLGPDFVSHQEGLFCDMSEKKLWPLCSQAHKHACFDPETSEMRPGDVNSLNGRDESSGTPVPEKSYQKITHWR
ncbi:hypothetical protein K440DRAFT_656168 [Wilcoxina mikolae CBS 423.85]|nr:hypothetical protein K440DRAFT_656168 [Wilcoxina mikolae CBS 423.85]